MNLSLKTIHKHNTWIGSKKSVFTFQLTEF